MKTITYEEFLEFEPCWLGNARKMKQLKSYFEAIPNMSALDMLGLDEVTIKERFWAVLREELILANILHEFACLCAEHALSKIENPDPRSVDVITAKRKWIKGEITDAELEAARGAARAVARDAARAVAWAVSDVAYGAAKVASEVARVARVVARETERQWQLDTLIKLIKEGQENENDNI